jgi:predicted nicotinamide N-methyase
MSSANDQQHILRTSTGEFQLQEYWLRQSGRAWTILHTGAILTYDDEEYFFRELMSRLPYGVALWPASIALAHEVASRASAFRGCRILELGAGTGLPGIVAATLGGRVVQTDRQEVAMAICRRNGERNSVTGVEYRQSDWTTWNDTERYDWILGSDILYSEAVHADLQRIFENNLTANGRILLSDPFRDASFRLLEAMEADGWVISVSKWNIGEETAPRSIGLFELARP